jgi:hypothetical protein
MLDTAHLVSREVGRVGGAHRHGGFDQIGRTWEFLRSPDGGGGRGGAIPPAHRPTGLACEDPDEDARYEHGADQESDAGHERFHAESIGRLWGQSCRSFG